MFMNTVRYSLQSRLSSAGQRVDFNRTVGTSVPTASIRFGRQSFTSFTSAKVDTIGEAPHFNFQLLTFHFNSELSTFNFHFIKTKTTVITVVLCCVGIALSSRAASSQVLSALMSLTTVFGMGTGGPSSLKTPTIECLSVTSVSFSEAYYIRSFSVCQGFFANFLFFLKKVLRC